MIVFVVVSRLKGSKTVSVYIAKKKKEVHGAAILICFAHEQECRLFVYPTVVVFRSKIFVWIVTRRRKEDAGCTIPRKILRTGCRLPMI